MPDALGSVTAIRPADSTTVKTLTYTPYGLGSSTGPRYGWVGTWGYRANPYGRTPSHYVRARHFDNRSGLWTTADPLWPSEFAFAYCEAGPVASIDPTGNRIQNAEKEDDECYKKFLLLGSCNNFFLKLQLETACFRSGSVPCILARASEDIDIRTGECKGCCTVCYPTCDEALSKGGVMCDGSKTSDILRCAKKSLKKLAPDKLTGKPPEVTEAQRCIKTGLGGNCIPIGKRLHLTYNCQPRKGAIKKTVISALCCPCYKDGIVKIVCFNPQGCHS
ncbi:MAG: hypothetical protein JST35_05390 [Armatimonadetes bacterium]|nr:hypothetical protein [Armatimonadota bacterium]